MSRKRPPNKKQLVLYLDDEDAQAIDTWMISLGLDSRSAAALTMMRAGLSAIPQDTVVFNVCQESVRQLRRYEFEALAEFYSGRAKMYRASP